MKRVFAVVMLALAPACAPPIMDARPAPPVASSGYEQRLVRGSGDAVLFERSWHPEGPARAAVVIHHGLKSHSEHYAELASRLVARGFSVYAYDMRGHGRSAGRRASLDDFDDLASDLASFVERVRAREENRPIFVVGHSVGGAVATLYVVDRHPNIAGLVLLAPAIRVDRLPIEAAATPMTALLLPNLPVVDVPDTWFSRTPAIVAEMGNDPLIYHPPGPARTAAGLIRALETIWRGVDTIDIPILAMHGTADRATDPRGSAELVRRVHSRDRTLILYRGLYHDLVREPERAQVMDDLVQWLDARTPNR